MPPPSRKTLLFALTLLQASFSAAIPNPQVTAAPSATGTDAWRDCTPESASECAGIIYDPATWCQPFATNVLYPTISGETGSAACAFTASPTSTVLLGIQSKYLIATVSSCASKFGITVQPSPSSTTTPISVLAEPTAPSKCYPTHDAPYKDLQVEASPSDIASFCAGTDAGWESRDGPYDPSSPPANNQVQQGIILAPNAPDECKSFYAAGHSSDVTTLCTLPFQKILADCPYNGGENTNVCGTFWMETCPLGEQCVRGSPGGPPPVVTGKGS